MNVFLPFPILVILVAGLAAAAGPRPAFGADTDVVARVNGDPVTRAQLDRMVANPLTLQQAQRELGVEEPDHKELERLAMRNLVHLRLLVQEAGRRNITVTREELDEAIAALRRRFDDLKEFGEWVKEQGVNDPELFETVRTDMLAARVTAALAEGVSVTEEQVGQYYEAHRDDVVIGAEVRLRIIAVDNEPAAEEILAALRKGTSFHRLARERSHGKLAAKGGDTGWVGFHRLPPLMQEAVAALKEGDVAGPVERSAEEFLLIGLQGRRPLRAKNLAQARPEIDRRLLAEKRREVVQQWLAEQEKKSKIEILARAAGTEGSMKADAGTEVSGNIVEPDLPQALAAPPDPAQGAPALAGPKEKLSYALGMTLGKQFRDRSIEVDPDVYLLGVKDGLSGGNTLLTEAEARSAVNALQSELKRRKAAPQAPGAPPDIAVSFKMDPRITRGLYMGDRWISPPTFTSTGPEGREVTVYARAEVRDAAGRKTKISPQWIPADPEMVDITPGEGKEVKITVKRAGETTLKVAAQGYSKNLSIRASAKGDTMQVEIAQ